MNKLLPKPLTQLQAAALLSATFVALAAFAAPAAPRAGARSTSIDVPLARTAKAAPCPGESVRLSGVIHLLVRTGPGAGSHTVETLDLRDARGRGVTSGAAYRFEAAAKDRHSVPCGPGEGCATKALMPFDTAGEGPDGGLRGHLTVNVREHPGGALAAELVEFKFVCPQ